MSDDKIVKKLIFPEYTCEIFKSGDVFFSDHYAEHMIYIYKTQFEKILKSYNDAFMKKKTDSEMKEETFENFLAYETYYNDMKKKYPHLKIWDELLDIFEKYKCGVY